MGPLDRHALGSLHHPEPSQSEVCLSPAALRDPLPRSRGLSCCFTIPSFSVSQKGQVPSRKVKAAPIQRLLPDAHVFNITGCLNALRADCNLSLLKLAEAQDQRDSGVVAPLIERLETDADALRVVLMFNCDKRSLQRRL